MKADIVMMRQPEALRKACARANLGQADATRCGLVTAWWGCRALRAVRHGLARQPGL